MGISINNADCARGRKKESADLDQDDPITALQKKAQNKTRRNLAHTFFYPASTWLASTLGFIFIRIPLRVFGYLTIRVLALCLVLSLLYAYIEYGTPSQFFSSGKSANIDRPPPDMTKFYTNQRYFTPQPKQTTEVITGLEDHE